MRKIAISGRGRKNHNGILIELESLINMDIGFLKYIKFNISNAKGFNFILKTDEELQQMKISDPNFPYSFFDKEMYSRDDVDNMFRILMETEAEEIIKLSPEVESIGRLISLFSKETKDIAFCDILVRNKEYVPYLKNRFPSLSFLEDFRNEEASFFPYAKFIIEDMDRLEKFYDKIQFTHITVLSYAKNIQAIGNRNCLKSESLMLFGVTNEFNVIDPFIGR